LAQDTRLLRVHAPEMAANVVPGQFFMVRDPSGNDPLIGRAFAVYDCGGPNEGWLDIVYLVKGKLTTRLAKKQIGDAIALWGPLGNGFTTTPVQQLVMVAGGIGQTPFLSLAREALGLKRFGNSARSSGYAKKVHFCYGARSKAYLTGVADFEAMGVGVSIATDDGSVGPPRLVTDALTEFLDRSPPASTRIVCCGPEPMMRAVAEGFRAGGKPGLMLSHTFSAVSAEARALTESHGIAYSGGGLDHVLTALVCILRAQRNDGSSWRPDMPASSMAETGRPTTEREVLDHLAAHGVGVIPARIVSSADEAAEVADAFDAPVVLKILSPDIPHKTEVGGVALGLKGADQVRAAHDAIRARVATARPDAKVAGIIVSPMRAGGVELFIGTMRDPQWGPAIAVGLGGIFVEALKDTSLDLLPISEAQALAMLGRLKGKALLDGFRGATPVDRAALARTIVAVGEAALALGPGLVSLEVNPLLAEGSRIEALDGLAVWEDAHADA
ncbi:MAG: hypothetical protein B7Z44_19590, partial [Caulobacter sp. 12-67-6]